MNHENHSAFRILIVDDVSVMRKFITKMLTCNGFPNVTYAENGIVALQKLQVEKIDCVITDWSMPNMSGLGLLKKMREDPLLKEVPVIMVTSHVEPKEIARAIRAGISNYIVKPFGPGTLIGKLQSLLKSKESALAK